MSMLEWMYWLQEAPQPITWHAYAELSLDDGTTWTTVPGTEKSGDGWEPDVGVFVPGELAPGLVRFYIELRSADPTIEPWTCFTHPAQLMSEPRG